MTEGVLQQGGRAQVSEPLAAPPPTLAWKRSWLGSRFSSKAEVNAPKPQPYPLTADGKVPV